MPKWLTISGLTMPALLSLMLFSFNAQGNINIGDFVPESYIYNEHGDKILLDHFEGKPTLLVFWASWSVGCREELIKLDLLAKDFKKIPLNIVAVSLDYGRLNLIDDFYNKYEIRYLKKYYDCKHQLFKLLATNSVPTSYLLSRDGKIIWQKQGANDWHKNEIRAKLLQHIIEIEELPRNSFKESLIQNKLFK